MVRPVRVDNHSYRPQAGNNLALGVESCVPFAIVEVTSRDSMSGEAVCGLQLVTVPQTRSFPHPPCIEDWSLD